MHLLFRQPMLADPHVRVLGINAPVVLGAVAVVGLTVGLLWMRHLMSIETESRSFRATARRTRPRLSVMAEGLAVAALVLAVAAWPPPARPASVAARDCQRVERHCRRPHGSRSLAGMGTTLAGRPPFVIRARILTPLAAGGTRYEADGRLAVDARGVIADVGSWPAGGPGGEADGTPAVDLRPLVLMPGMVDLHVHLPQLPNAGVGAGLDVLAWLGRYTFPIEHDFDEAAAERLAPAAFRAFAAAGTTTAVIYGAVYEPSLDAVFRAAEAHGIRAVIGKVMMDRGTYDERLRPDRILETSLRQSADLCSRWDGRDAGRLRYAFTPRFAVTCSAEMLRESAALARSTGAYWQTHLAESRPELAEVARLFPYAVDYLDVYDRAGALGPRTILAHAIHLSDREVARLAESGSAVAHCPASNLFLASGAMPLARYRAAGVRVGLGSDVSGGPELSLFAAIRAGAYTQNALRVAGRDATQPLDPLDWLRLATYEGAQVLGIEHEIGSLEPGKEADLVAVDPRLVAPVEGVDSDEPSEVMSRLAFRPHPDMVRAAWVRGRLLDGPPGIHGSGR